MDPSGNEIRLEHRLYFFNLQTFAQEHTINRMLYLWTMAIKVTCSGVISQRCAEIKKHADQCHISIPTSKCISLGISIQIPSSTQQVSEPLY